ncbi:hypothetical protein [Nonomuraea jiangxiensis]|uniref:Uncharacterized protein n=1 Tax=Nonomuraea jiangxiensis TaxID=633440 RepID=A0A1G9ITQ9_9ACTN|nr:hypothetical protein [Nonomuraea jiangxiensis]SDL28688.1 hypothetical protein SAMN05421869_12451 [Nonomuraea jiangxiensis]
MRTIVDLRNPGERQGDLSARSADLTTVNVPLALAGVRPDDIAGDYELSAPRLPGLFAALGIDDQTDRIQDILVRKNTTARATMLDALDGLDVEDRLRAAGLSAQEIQAVRDRLVGT